MALPSSSHEPKPGGATVDLPIKVPVVGEGIRSARIVSLLKQPGDRIERDDAICEIETDKAVYPIESEFPGVLKEWRCQMDDEVAIGREIAVLTVDAQRVESGVPAPESAAPAEPPPARPPARQQQEPLDEKPDPTATETRDALPPALPVSMTRRLAQVVPVNMQLDAGWKTIRAAREQAKAAKTDHSPSMMLAWCVTRAMEAHAPFQRLVLNDGRIVEQSPFDLGIAVALEGDRLATAVLHRANELAWPDFAAAYTQAITNVRAGRIEEVHAPINVTSLGAFGIEQATPILVPPAMGTLFIGKAHERLVNDNGAIYPIEVATLSLTFDHRVVNGAAAAAFLQDLKAQVEGFVLPA